MSNTDYQTSRIARSNRSTKISSSQMPTANRNNNLSYSGSKLKSAQPMNRSTLMQKVNEMYIEDFLSDFLLAAQEDYSREELSQKIVSKIANVPFNTGSKQAQPTESLGREVLDKAAARVAEIIEDAYNEMLGDGTVDQKMQKVRQQLGNYNVGEEVADLDTVQANSRKMREWMKKHPNASDTDLLGEYNKYNGKLDDRTKGKVYKKLQSITTLGKRTEQQKTLSDLRKEELSLKDIKDKAGEINYAITPAIKTDTKYKYIAAHDIRESLDNCILSGRHIDYYLINNSLISMYIANETICNPRLFPTGIEFDKENPDPRDVREYDFVRSRAPVGFFNGDFILWDHCIKSKMINKTNIGYKKAHDLINSYDTYLKPLSETSIKTTELNKNLTDIGKTAEVYTARYTDILKIALKWLKEKVAQSIEYLTFFEQFDVLPGFIDLQCVTFDHVFTYSLIAYFINRASASAYAVNVKPLWNTKVENTDLNHLVNINSVIYKNDNAGIKKSHGGKGGGKIESREKEPRNGEISLPSKPGFRKNFMVVDPFNALLDNVPSDLKEGIVLLCKAKIIPKTILERFIVYCPKFEIVNYKTKEKSHFYKFSVTSKTFNKKLIQLPRHYLISEKCNKLAKFYHCKYFNKLSLLPAMQNPLNINFDYCRIYHELILQPIIALLYATYIVRKEMLVYLERSGTTINDKILSLGSKGDILLYLTNKKDSHQEKNINNEAVKHYGFVGDSYFTQITQINSDVNARYRSILQDELIANDALQTIKDLVAKKEYSEITDLSINFGYEDFYPIFEEVYSRMEVSIGSDNIQVDFQKNYASALKAKLDGYKK